MVIRPLEIYDAESLKSSIIDKPFSKPGDFIQDLYIFVISDNPHEMYNEREYGGTALAVLSTKILKKNFPKGYNTDFILDTIPENVVKVSNEASVFSKTLHYFYVKFNIREKDRVKAIKDGFFRTSWVITTGYTNCVLNNITNNESGNLLIDILMYRCDYDLSIRKRMNDVFGRKESVNLFLNSFQPNDPKVEFLYDLESFKNTYYSDIKNIYRGKEIVNEKTKIHFVNEIIDKDSYNFDKRRYLLGNIIEPDKIEDLSSVDGDPSVFPSLDFIRVVDLNSNQSKMMYMDGLSEFKFDLVVLFKNFLVDMLECSLETMCEKMSFWFEFVVFSNTGNEASKFKVLDVAYPFKRKVISILEKSKKIIIDKVFKLTEMGMLDKIYKTKSNIQDFKPVGLTYSNPLEDFIIDIFYYDNDYESSVKYKITMRYCGGYEIVFDDVIVSNKVSLLSDYVLFFNTF